MRRKFICIFLLLAILGGSPLYAKLQGQAKIDSMLKELPRQKEDTNKVNLLRRLVKAYRQINAGDATKYNDQALALARSLGWQRGTAKIYYDMGIEQEMISNFPKALEWYAKSLKIYEEMRDDCHAARCHYNIGSCYNYMGKVDSSLAEAQKALALFKTPCDSHLLMSINVNLSNSYITLKEYAKVQEITEACLKVWNENWTVTVARNGLYTNRAIAIATLKGPEVAVAAFRDVLRNAEKEKLADNYADAIANMAAVFGMLLENGRNIHYMDSANYYQKASLELYRQAGNKDGLALSYYNLGLLQRHCQRFSKGIVYLDSAEMLARELKMLELLVDVTLTQSECLYHLGMVDSAFNVLWTHKELKDSLLNTEKVKAITEMQEKYESEKKARTIKELEINKISSQLRQVQLKRTRNIVAAVGVIILLLAIALWNRLNYTRRSRALVQKEKDRSDELLLNILPAEVAEELKAKGSAEAKLIDDVTVLFTDFKGFTQLSEKLTAKELVGEINECFSAFDNIMHKHGVEKIKTIGDAYMAAGGLPTPNKTHAMDVVTAALEIQDFMHRHKEER
ncbi:MAG: hypothetical protein K9G42_01180, partial [Pedobacter sp.]|nr:hypothetical protein [Pedobacter sp.]